MLAIFRPEKCELVRQLPHARSGGGAAGSLDFAFGCVMSENVRSGCGGATTRKRSETESDSGYGYRRVLAIATWNGSVNHLSLVCETGYASESAYLSACTVSDVAKSGVGIEMVKKKCGRSIFGSA